MIYSKSGLLILLRVVILSGFIAGAVISYFKTHFVVTPTMFIILTLISICELTWHLQKLQRSWARFLLSIQHNDFNRNYNDQKEFRELNEAYNLITESFENLSVQKHADYQLLQTVSEHIQIGLICYLKNGEIIFANRAIKSMLGIETFLNVESLREGSIDIHNYLVSNKAVTSALVKGSNEQRILIKTEAFALQNQTYRLASLYDIRSTLDTNELESYQKLMGVMTHEIMNSTTPILSLIQVVNKKLVYEEKLNPLPSIDQKNVAISLKAIELRTSGMLRFVEAYRKINKDIKPRLERISTKSLIDPIVALTINQSKASFSSKDQVAQDLMIDPDLISQVIINLLKNAEEATLNIEKAVIRLFLEISGNDLSIVIEDNGPGIPAGNLTQVFVPFYTTKSSGSGIGLALSRRIIKVHGGSLNYRRTEQGTTQFRILLPGAINTLAEK